HPAGVCAPLGALHVQTVDHSVDLRPDAVEVITKIGRVSVRDMITHHLQFLVLSVQPTEDYGACDGRDDQAKEAERRRDGVLEQFGGHGVSPFGWAPAGVVSSASAVEDRSSASSMRFRRRSMSRRIAWWNAGNRSYIKPRSSPSSSTSSSAATSGWRSATERNSSATN